MRTTALLVLGLFAAAAGVTVAQRVETRPADSPEVLLKTAMNRELVDGDVQAAIERYRDITARYRSVAPSVAAKALLQMAASYDRIGSPEARKAYEEILRAFPDQRDAVAAARAHLARTTQGTAAAQTLTTARVLDRGYPHDRISPDGRYLARHDRTENLFLYELATDKVRWLTADGSPEDPDHRFPLARAFARDGRQIAYQWYFEIKDQSVLRVIGTDEGAAKTPRTLYDNPDADVAPTDWSPDGRWIAVVVRRKDRTAQIGVVGVADGALRVLKTVDWSRVGGLRFSPDSSRLAYHRPASDGAFERDVFVIAVDGSRETVAAQSPADDVVLEWALDGERLLITSDRGGSQSVWSVPVDGPAAASRFELIKSDIGTISSLGPTRTGALYYNLQPGGSDIHVAQFDAATGQLSSPPVSPLKQFKGLTSGAEWSSDGKFLVYASLRDVPAPINVTRPILTILAADTGQVVRELHPAVSYGGFGPWSPDGRQFIARGADLKGRSGILTVDALTGEARLVALNETCSGKPYWNPDGKSVYCARERQIVQVDVASGNVLRTLPAEGQGAGVSPDGRYIVYGDGMPRRVLRLLTLATGETSEILSLSPSSETQIFNWNSVTWTPDGRSVVFYGRLQGDEGMWLVPIDGRPPHKINVDIKPISMWRFNPKTGQVLLASNLGPRLEVWKMENFQAPAISGQQSAIK